MPSQEDRVAVQDKKVFKSGAVRSDSKPRYDLIPTYGLTRLAQRYTIGAEKYGEWNWQKGIDDHEYVQQFKNHMMSHFLDFLDNGCVEDDNLAAMVWGCMALMERERLYGLDANKNTVRASAGKIAPEFNRGMSGIEPTKKGG